MMELEQRVQALEQELQILKNQIQVMLLDIQEQVLSNTYPDLRSGDGSLQENRSASHPEPEVAPRHSHSSPVHKVSFDDLATEEQRVSPSVPEKQASQTAWQGMEGLEAWASEKLETLGTQETVDLIQMYAAQGRFAPEVQDALLEFVALNSSNYPDSPTQPSRAAVVKAVPVTPPTGRAKKAPTPAARAMPAAPPPTQAKTPKVKASTPPINPKKKTVKPEIETSKTQDDGSQNIVLKLIAGVQNAGAGVRWGKHDG